jgi:hypothetical protein
MTTENLIVAIGFIAVVATLYRINLVLAQEFPDEDDFVKCPLAYAVSSTIDFNKFKENSWKGFEALWAAIQFRAFYKRYSSFISPRDAKICAFGMLGLFITVLVVAEIMKADPKVNGQIGATVTVINLLWWVIIERCKFLKKSVDKLRVT